MPASIIFSFAEIIKDEDCFKDAIWPLAEEYPGFSERNVWLKTDWASLELVLAATVAIGFEREFSR